MTLLAFNWGLFSWVYWALWIVMFLAYEIPAVLFEKRKGTLPFTRVSRDRLMRRSVVFRLVGLLVLAWLSLHYVTNLPW